MVQQEVEGMKDQNEFAVKDLKRYDGRVLTKTMLTLDSISAWSEDENKKPREKDTEAVYSLEESGERLLTEILHTDSLGTALVIEYAKKFPCSRDKVVKRENTGLYKRDYTARGSKEECAKLVTLATSISKTALEKVGTIEGLKSELMKLQQHVRAEGFPDLSKLTLKSQFVDALVAVRTKAFGANESLCSQFKKEAEDSAYGGKSTAERSARGIGAEISREEARGQPRAYSVSKRTKIGMLCSFNSTVVYSIY